MKAAAVAAERGHHVTLCEATGQLGGQALLAQLLPGRAEFGGIVTNLKRELELAGVEVRLHCRVSSSIIETLCPDSIIMATGATPYLPKVDIGGDVHVADAWQILKGETKAGSAVVIADWRCDWVGLGLAEKLVLEGSHVRMFVCAWMAKWPGRTCRNTCAGTGSANCTSSASRLFPMPVSLAQQAIRLSSCMRCQAKQSRARTWTPLFWLRDTSLKLVSKGSSGPAGQTLLLSGTA